MARPTKAIIDLSALQHNCQLVKNLCPQSKNMAIIKADAYGHGAIAVARALEDMVHGFGVAYIEEALALRKAGITTSIHVLEGAITTDEIDLAAEENISLAVTNQEQKLAILAAQPVKPLQVWLSVDTGMRRLGIYPDEMAKMFNQLKACDHVQDELVITTHFACADDVGNDFTSEQMRRLNGALEQLRSTYCDSAREFTDPPLSLANSAALLAWPNTRAEWNRPGIMLYGASPLLTPHKIADQLRPVMTLTSAIIALRDVPAGETVGYAATWRTKAQSRIATVAIGYGDGYPLQMPSGTPVLINGQRCPIVGRVSMDMITVDVSLLSSAALGDEVVLWGRGLPVEDIAQCVGSISYELLTRMPLRTPRQYIT